MSIAYVDGVYLPADEARISIADRGFTYGDGVFTTIKVSGGAPGFLGWHLERLLRDAAALYMRSPSHSELADACRGLISRLGVQDGVVKIMISRGTGGRGPSTKNTVGLTVVVTFSAPPEPRPPLRAITVPDARGALAAHKTLNYLPNVLALHEAEAAGCDEAVFVRGGLLLEATVSNLVGMAGGELRTPARDGAVLGGVARRALLETGVLREGELPQDSSGPLYCVNNVRGIEEVAVLDGRELDLDPELHKELQRTLEEQSRRFNEY